MKNILKLIFLFLISLIPIEFIGLMTDYQTGLLLGYLPFIIVTIILGYLTRSFILYFLVFVSRILGTFIFVLCANLCLNFYEVDFYFKPFDVLGFVVFLSILSQLMILITIGLV